MMIDDGPFSHPHAKKRKIDEESKKCIHMCKDTKKSTSLSKQKQVSGLSRAYSKPHASLKKGTVVHTIEERNAPDATVAVKKKQSLSMSDLDDIKSYVKTYDDMKFNELQTLMIAHYTGIVKAMKEGFTSYDKTMSDNHLKNCGLFVAVYAAFLSDGHQIPSSEFDSGLHHARYASLLWDYEINQAFTGMSSGGECQNFWTSFETCLDDQNSKPTRSGRVTLAIVSSPSTRCIGRCIRVDLTSVSNPWHGANTLPTGVTGHRIREYPQVGLQIQHNRLPIQSSRPSKQGAASSATSGQRPNRLYALQS
ncbi:hypothetical protein FXO38_20141 [Capsicum annuum]|nr:hypothetical protein FXO38_20141 [Capsicum annuum]KAF3683945.1 hypothetical protein FXO37_01602 [Capsicum annuum]